MQWWQLLDTMGPFVNVHFNLARNERNDSIAHKASFCCLCIRMPEKREERGEKREKCKQKTVNFSFLKLILLIPFVTNTIRLNGLCLGPDILSSPWRHATTHTARASR